MIEYLPREDIAEKGIIIGDKRRFKGRLGIGVMLKGRCFGGHLGGRFVWWEELVILQNC